MGPERSLPLFRCTSNFEYETVSRQPLLRKRVTRPFRHVPVVLFLVFCLHLHSMTNWLEVRESARRRNIVENLAWRRERAATVPAETVRIMPFFANRFNCIWRVPPRVRFLTADQSRNRFLYSSLRAKASDGIGHGVAIMNAEVGAALRLGLTYTHRVASYGSLTLEDPLAVERLFGWGVGQISRDVVKETFCNTEDDGFETECSTCESLRVNHTFRGVSVDTIVEIPRELSYKRPRCNQMSDAQRQSVCLDPLWKFIRENNVPNTIFQMARETCRSSPVDSYFDRDSRNYLFHKYWDLHGVRNGGWLWDADTLENTRTEAKSGLPVISLAQQRINVQFRQHELAIAVHARRGDFFAHRRPMVSCEAIANVIRQLMRHVTVHGGVFGALPVAVHVYSEGVSREDMTDVGHVVGMLSEDFVDADGTVRTADWIKGVIAGTDDSQHGLFANGLRVVLHVSTDTVATIHDMIAADVFIGSDSAMGKYAVAMLSRGAVQFLPDNVHHFEDEGSAVAFRLRTGEVLNHEKVARLWTAYAEANRFSVLRAHAASRFSTKSSARVT